MPTKTLLLGVICLFCITSAAQAQDTVRVSLQEFVSRGIENSGQIKAARQKIFLAENQVDQVQDERYLSTFNLTTQHGLVPKVDEDVSMQGAFLDDLSNLTLSTEAELELLQPIFTWGALRNAVKASKMAAEATESQFQITKEETRLRLFNLYQSYLLSLEVQRLLDEAQRQINRVESALEDSTNQEMGEVDQSEIFKFKVFKSEFAIRSAEVYENTAYVKRVWSYVLQADEGTVYMPEERFLDPIQNELKTLGYYKSRALAQRPEINALEAGIDAAEYGLQAVRSKKYPALFVGVSATYLNTPNPPVGNYSFMLNETNYATAAVGIGFRQNLDFFDLNTDEEKSRIQLKQAEYSKAAAIDGIVLEINEKYKDVNLSKVKMKQTNEALSTSKRWVRQEQLQYDLGTEDFEPKDLIDAIKKELELEVKYKREIFNFNQDMAELFKASDLSVIKLTTNYSE